MFHRSSRLFVFQTSACVVAAALLAVGGRADKGSKEIEPVKPADFQRLHRLIPPQLGEQRYLDIKWMSGPNEAQLLAAKEVKPILIFTQVGDPMGHL